MRIKETTDRITPNIDPRLQRVISWGQNDQRQDNNSDMVNAEMAGTTAEIAVIAKVSDIEKWKEISGVRQIADLGSVPDESGNVRLVTARVALNQIEEVRKSPIVMSLKASQTLKPQLNRTVEDIKAGPEFLPPDSKSNGGSGVVIGIVDYGCDFNHENFKNPDGTTRILRYWDQDAIAANDTTFRYGRVITKEEINQALRTQNPFETLNIPDPKKDKDPRTGEIDHWHGTHVMDIAAGNGRGTQIPGVAPKADIIFVQINADDVPRQGPKVVEGNFGGSVHLLEALQFISETAGERPCVMNISLGTNGGSHDGKSLVEAGIDTVVHAAPNRAIVLAASNSYADGVHASGVVKTNESYDLNWIVDSRDFTFNELELWYDKNDEFLCEVITPQGKNLGQIKLGTNHQVFGEQNEVLTFISHRRNDPNNGDNVINIFMEGGFINGLNPESNWNPTGKWTIRLRGIRINSGQFHAWIERDDTAQSHFNAPSDNTHTLGSICCGKKSIVVGSYDAKTPNTPISRFSSAGPTRDGRQKPEISAPGHGVNAAASGTNKEKVVMFGTSMAAPAVTGVIALMLAEAHARGIKLSNDEIHEILRTTARPMASGWHDRYGYGQIDANKAVNKVADLVPVH